MSYLPEADLPDSDFGYGVTDGYHIDTRRKSGHYGAAGDSADLAHELTGHAVHSGGACLTVGLDDDVTAFGADRSEEHTSELQSR